MNSKISKICTVDFSWAVTFFSVNNHMQDFLEFVRDQLLMILPFVLVYLALGLPL